MKIINNYFDLTKKELDALLENNSRTQIPLNDDELNYLKEFVELKDDIALNGQTTPIIINEKREVIDGYKRLAVLSHLKQPIKFIIIDGADLNTRESLNIKVG